LILAQANLMKLNKEEIADYYVMTREEKSKEKSDEKNDSQPNFI